MAGLPLDDWQFYVVSAAFLAATWLIVRPLWPRQDASGGCPNCASSEPKRPRKTGLTVEGKRP